MSYHILEVGRIANYAVDYVIKETLSPSLFTLFQYLHFIMHFLLLHQI